MTATQWALNISAAMFLVFYQYQGESASAKNSEKETKQRSSKVTKKGHQKVNVVLDEFKLLGSVVQPDGNWDQALEKYKQAQSANPNSVETAYNIALCETHLQRYSSAELSIKNAIRLNPLFAPNFSLMAAIYRLQGKEAEAKDAEARSKQL